MPRQPAARPGPYVWQLGPIRRVYGPRDRGDPDRPRALIPGPSWAAARQSSIPAPWHDGARPKSQALSRIRAKTSAALSDGSADQISAARPAAWGQAPLVPQPRGKRRSPSPEATSPLRRHRRHQVGLGRRCVGPGEGRAAARIVPNVRPRGRRRRPSRRRAAACGRRSCPGGNAPAGRRPARGCCPPRRARPRPRRSSPPAPTGNRCLPPQEEGGPP